MKKFKSVLAILLALALLCFAGCGTEVGFDKEAEENIVGSWNCELDFSEMMASKMNSQGFGDLGLNDIPFYVYIVMDFTEDKTCSLGVDRDATLISIQNYVDDMMVVLIDYMYEIYEDQSGMTREETDEYFETYLGMSFSDYIAELMAASLDPEELAASFDNINSGDGYYKLDDGKLYIADTEEELAECENYVSYLLAGDILTLDNGNTDSFSSFEAMGVELPLVFERAN